MKSNKNIKILLSVLIIVSLMLFNVGSNAAYNIVENETYKKWQSKSQEEKEKTIQPVPFTIDIKDSIKRSTLNAKLKASQDELPERYNLNEHINIKVKDQMSTNSCWAFSTTSVFETTIAKTKGKSMSFSPRHMEYATSRTFLNGVINEKGFYREVDSGGNPYIGLTHCATGNGPVLESDMPFENNINKIDISNINNKNVAVKLEEYRMFPSIAKKNLNGNIEYNNDNGSTYTKEEVEVIRDVIKEHIKEYGAISAYTYTSDELEYFNTDKMQSEQANGYAYYCNNENIVANHAVTIVGWDDKYSADNFSNSSKPKNDGAYIALNSYGEAAFDKGYFYISYDDFLVENGMVGIAKTGDIDYDNIYQHDEFGQSYRLNLANEKTDEKITSIYAANVYTKNKNQNEDEYLNEISIMVYGTSNVEIYANVESDDKTKIEKVASPGILDPGYHTIKLPTPLKITGDKFVVAAKYVNQEGVYIPIECNLKANGGDSSYWDVVTSQKGESFISRDGNEWQDLEEAGVVKSNVCVKAFTTYEKNGNNRSNTGEDDNNNQGNKEIKVESISLNKNKIEIVEGESTNLEVTFNPTNVTNKNVEWKVDDSNIATVDKNGNITAKKEGTTTITVISEDGAKIAKCQVTVKKKVNSDDDIYYESKDEQVEEINKLNQKLAGDTTVAKQIIPYAGNKIVITICIIAIVGVGIYTYIRIKNYKDVK